jgi:hypothetical protein
MQARRFARRLRGDKGEGVCEAAGERSPPPPCSLVKRERCGEEPPHPLLQRSNPPPRARQRLADHVRNGGNDVDKIQIRKRAAVAL